MSERIDHLWTDRARCLDYDPEMWFPVGNGPTSPDAKRAADAAAICVTCPVRVQCARHALNQGRVYGIWAGYRIDPERRADPKRPLRDYLKRAGESVELGPASVVCAQCGDTYVPHSARTKSVCRFCIDDLVDSDDARAHIITLSRDLPFTVIGEQAGTDRYTISEIARGKRPRIKTALSARILALRVGEPVRA